jgi:polyisoprenoid-binding protein YceI
MHPGNSEYTRPRWLPRRQAGTLRCMPPRTAMAFLLFALGAGAPLHAQMQDYQYDPVHSQVIFSIDHNGYSRSFGRAPLVSGVLHLDEKNLAASSTTLDIDLSRVDMGNADWSAVVRGANLLATDKYPRAHFQSTGVDATDASSGVLHGQLTFRGVTRPLDIAFHVNRVARTIYGMHTVAGISATASLDRNAFGITGNAGSVGSTVSFWLELEAIRADTGSTHPEPDHAAAQ